MVGHSKRPKRTPKPSAKRKAANDDNRQKEDNARKSKATPPRQPASPSRGSNGTHNTPKITTPRMVPQVNENNGTADWQKEVNARMHNTSTKTIPPQSISTSTSQGSNANTTATTTTTNTQPPSNNNLNNQDVLHNKSPPKDGTPPACNVTPNATTTATVAPTTTTTSGASAAGLTECEQVLKGGGDVKGWSLAILNDIYAEPSDDGNLVQCSACGIKGRTQGVLTMRHPYAEDNWNSHCRSQGHSNDVANLEAEKEVAGLNGLTQKPMTNFFCVVRKKKVVG